MARIAVVIAAFLIAFASAGPSAGASDPAFGYWRTAEGGAIVEITPCPGGRGACGRLVWIRGADDTSRRDADGRPLCGLELVRDLKRAGDGVWERGEIVDPRSGRRYGAEIAVIDPSRLEVRGYLLARALGSSQVWTRAADDRGGC